MAQVKYVGGNGPLEVPTPTGVVSVEDGGTVDVPADLAAELVARGDFKKATGGNAKGDK